VDSLGSDLYPITFWITDDGLVIAIPCASRPGKNWDSLSCHFSGEEVDCLVTSYFDRDMGVSKGEFQGSSIDIWPLHELKTGAGSDGKEKGLKAGSCILI